MAETARFGPSAGKTESTAATPPKFRSFHPLELFGLIHKRPGHDPFFAKNQFSPADEFVFMGLVVRSCHFDVTACAKARRLEKYILYMGFVEGPFHSRISLGACDCSYFHLCLKGSRQDSTDYSQDAICAINLCTHCTGKHNSELASLKSNFAARD